MPEENLAKIAREKAKLTRPQLAEKMGVSVRTVEGWESKRRPNQTAKKMLEALAR